MFGTNDDGKSIVEPKRRTNFKSETIAVSIPDCAVDRLGIVGRRFAQHSGQSRTGIFHVKVHLAGEHGLMADECSAEIEPAIDSQGYVRFDLLRQERGDG